MINLPSLLQVLCIQLNFKGDSRFYIKKYIPVDIIYGNHQLWIYFCNKCTVMHPLICTYLNTMILSEKKTHVLTSTSSKNIVLIKWKHVCTVLKKKHCFFWGRQIVVSPELGSAFLKHSNSWIFYNLWRQSVSRSRSGK